MTAQSAAEQIRRYLDEHEINYSKEDNGNYIYFEYGYSMEEFSLGPVSCCIDITDEVISCVTVLESEVCMQRRKQVGELILRINDRDGEKFTIDLDTGIISHVLEMSIQFDGRLSDEMIEMLVDWGVHVFGQYDSAFYSVMMYDADPKYVVECMGAQEVEFLPDGNLRWYTMI